MSRLNGEPAFDDTRPDREPVVEAGQDTQGTTVCQKEIFEASDDSWRVAMCNYGGVCTYAARQELFAQIVEGECIVENPGLISDIALQ
jgi:hypothetical protein